MLVDSRLRIGAAAPKSVVLSLEETSDLNGTSIEALPDFAAERSRCGVTLFLARFKDQVLALPGSSLGDATQMLLKPGSVNDAVVTLEQALASEVQPKQAAPAK